ncbi:hypothetical protein [Bacteroides acidifaciens]|uniref:hypothetical protein n=1 Tax=Bacteroides acidifaciens TaxID=85831 RepID=UPI00301518D4
MNGIERNTQIYDLRKAAVSIREPLAVAVLGDRPTAVPLHIKSHRQERTMCNKGNGYRENIKERTHYGGIKGLAGL